MRKFIATVVAVGMLVWSAIACAPPPTPEGFENIEYPCQVMLGVMKAAGAEPSELGTWLRIGRRESHCLLWAHAQDRDDDSYCWFQINYKGSLRGPRTVLYGPAQLLLEDPFACAHAALSLRATSGFSPWS